VGLSARFLHLLLLDLSLDRLGLLLLLLVLRLLLEELLLELGLEGLFNR